MVCALVYVCALECGCLCMCVLVWFVCVCVLCLKTDNKSTLIYDIYDLWKGSK